MELRHLRYFVAIAETGSFTRAAAKLHISQPPLSIQIKELESQISAQLLNRTSRGVTLTTAGAAFYEDAVAILERVERAKTKASRVAQGQEGTLRIGFVSIADYGILPDALREFRRRCPSVDVHLHELTTDAQLAEIQHQRIDVGIALAPIEVDQIVFEPLQSERLIAVLPAKHPKALRQKQISLADLANDSFVFTPRALAPGLHDAGLALCRSAGFVPNVAQYAKQMQTVISLVAGGFGVALVPESLRHLGRHGVKYLSLKEKSADIHLGAIYSRGDQNPLLRVFTESARLAAA